jgi:hypothetical protein
VVESARVILVVPLLLAADCGSCHAQQHEAWQRSRHATAGTNAAYLASHAREPMKWCDSCHAQEGVTCAACHVRGGMVLSTRAPSAAGLHAHAMQQDDGLSRSELCAGCHQFNFPVSREEPVRFSPHPMQNTFAEWRASGSAQQCQECHAAHDPAGPHDVPALRAAIRGEAKRVRDEVRMGLTPVGVAHHFPTGDPFRRLRLSLCSDVDCTGVVAVHELERKVRPTHDGWELSTDSTLPPEGFTVALHAPANAKFVRLSYRYAARSSEGALDDDEREATLFTQPISQGDAP